MNLILPKYFTLYIIYKKHLATPRKKQNNPLGVATLQVEGNCFRGTSFVSFLPSLESVFLRIRLD